MAGYLAIYAGPLPPADDPWNPEYPAWYSSYICCSGILLTFVGLVFFLHLLFWYIQYTCHWQITTIPKKQFKTHTVNWLKGSVGWNGQSVMTD